MDKEIVLKKEIKMIGSTANLSSGTISIPIVRQSTQKTSDTITLEIQ